MLSHVPAAFRNAFLSHGFRRFGPRFAADYLRFAFRCARRWGHTGPGSLRLLGRRIDYPNQSHALFLLHEIFAHGAYAFTTPSERPRIIDCGANVGFSVLYFRAAHPRARILAFEPEPGSCEWLRKNVETNGMDVEIRQEAVAERAGSLALITPAGDAGSILSSVHADWATGTPVAVPAIALSSVIDETVDFLKLDVEGAEYGVIRELIASGRIAKVKRLTVEYHAVAAEPGGAPELASLLTGAGMHVEIRDPGDGRSGLIVAARA